MTSRGYRIAVALVVVHIGIGVARIPTKVWGDREESIQHHREVGAVRYHVGNEHHFGAEVLERIRAECPEESVVLWRGEWKGALEFAPALLAPRLLVPAGRCPPGATRWGDHELATLREPSGDAAIPVLVGTGSGIELELR